MRQVLTAGSVLAILAMTPAGASEMSDFETALRQVYGSYRTALFMTNAGDAAKAAKAVAAFSDGWGKLATTYAKAPPPQYVDDAGWTQTLADVGEKAAAAAASVKDAKLPQAHEILEGVRGKLGDLHERNGLVLFSDRMNAYHAEMEKVLAVDPVAAGATYATQMLEYAGALTWLADELDRLPAPEAASDPDYPALSKAFRASVDGFANAARSGDVEQIRKAVAGLKVPYSKFFLKFG